MTNAQSLAVRTSSRQKCYRFGLFGRSESGKTCILAALSMPRMPNARKYTCDWIPHAEGLPVPVGSPANWKANDPAAAFHRGRLWLEGACQRLAAGDVPEPNPNRQAPFRFMFRFTDPVHGPRDVELIDYSGELLDPNIANDALAELVRQHMQEMDAILVLGEAPYPDGNGADLGEELHRLKQAFALLRGAKQDAPAMDVPVAMLVNKWDRRGNLDPQRADVEIKRLRDFLQEDPARAVLADTLRNSVTDGNFEAFPVSAFGRSERVARDGRKIERPAEVNPLRSFGLEDGFIWAATRRDAIDADQYQQNTRKTRVIWPWRSFAAWRQGSRLLRRLPRKSEARKRVCAGRRRALVAVGLHLFLLLPLFLIAQTFWDYTRYAVAIDVLKDPASSDAKWTASEEHLRHYYTHSPLWHLGHRGLILDGSQVMTLVTEYGRKRDEAQWKPIADAPDDLTRESLLMAYLRPGNRPMLQTDRARAELERILNARQTTQNGTAVAGLASRWGAINRPDMTVDDLLKFREEALKIFPHPRHVTPPQSEQLNRIMAQVMQLIADIQTIDRWRKLVVLVQSAMQQGMLSEAADLLVRCEPKDDKYGALVERDFCGKAVAAMRHRIRPYRDSHNWDAAREPIRRSLNDENVSKLLPSESILALNEMMKAIDLEHDQDLYAQLLGDRTMDRVQGYLTQAPGKRMEKSVLAYRKYLETCSGELPLTLVWTRINWGNCWNENDNWAKVFLNGSQTPLIHNPRIASKCWTTTGEIGRAKFTAKLNSTITLWIMIVDDNRWPMKDRDQGKGPYAGTVLYLNGRTITLPADGHETKATFQIDGIPVEPKLPKWGEE